MAKKKGDYIKDFLRAHWDLIVIGLMIILFILIEYSIIFPRCDLACAYGLFLILSSIILAAPILLTISIIRSISNKKLSKIRWVFILILFIILMRILVTFLKGLIIYRKGLI